MNLLLPYQNHITDISFVNTVTGYASTLELSDNSNINYLLVTTNKGLNWTYVNEFSGDYRSSVDFINANTGFFTSNSKIYKTTNGGLNWTEKFSFPSQNRYPRIRFGNANTGYCAFSKVYQSIPGTGGIYLYRTTNGGNNWDLTTINGYFTNTESRISDIAVSKSNPQLVAICGFQIIN